MGTSGWSYEKWQGDFYPEDLRGKDVLPYYAEHFDTAEVNNTFYNLPSEKTVRAWRDAVPRDFVFAVKASRYITHMKKLKDADETLPNLLDPLKPLGKRLGPVLCQLPPNWRFDPERLDDFLARAPRGARLALEFRDASWFDDEAYEILREHDAAFVAHDSGALGRGKETPMEVTADFAYVRFHGPRGDATGRYDKRRLAKWADRIDAWARDGRDVYAYFNNDADGWAPFDASRLRGMLVEEKRLAHA